uniref:Uncharacterized protein n=1 Tax=Solanum tuberosum TaxID=4113 RepID=M0ZPX9_SOLTU
MGHAVRGSDLVGAPMQARGGKPILWRKSGLVTLHQDGLSVKGKKNQSFEVQVVKKALKRCSLKYFHGGPKSALYSFKFQSKCKIQY